jgi:hypothetical protein
MCFLRQKLPFKVSLTSAPGTLVNMTLIFNLNNYATIHPAKYLLLLLLLL